MPALRLPRSTLVLLALLTGVAGPSAAAAEDPPDAAPALPAPDVLRAAWEGLDAEGRHDVADWYRLELSHRSNFQLGLVRYALTELDDDPGTLAVAPPLPYYDPEVHAPGEPIPRRRLAPDSALARSARERILGGRAPRRLVRARFYDWATGEILRLPDVDEDERVFANALQGLPPDLDLAEALVERALDDGSLRAELAAFGHAYTDRAGNVYPDLTLYDAWSSGASFETPDVDVLGLVHDLEDEWRRWKAPVPPSAQRRLYRTVEELFVPAHAHRAFRTALARTYLIGDAVLHDGYAPNLDRLHGLWEEHESRPAELAEDLPEASKWERYLERWVRRFDRDDDLREKAAVRRWTLEQNAREAYAVLVWVLREYGALE